MRVSKGTITIHLGGPAEVLPLPNNRRRIKLADGTIRTSYGANARPTPGWGTCYHCGASWDQVEGYTFYTDRGGFHPICAGCWLDLSSCQDRDTMSRVLALLQEAWQRDGQPPYTLAEMEAAVDRHWPTAGPKAAP